MGSLPPPAAHADWASIGQVLRSLLRGRSADAEAAALAPSAAVVPLPPPAGRGAAVARELARLSARILAARSNGRSRGGPAGELEALARSLAGGAARSVTEGLPGLERVARLFGLTSCS